MRPAFQPHRWGRHNMSKNRRNDLILTVLLVWLIVSAGLFVVLMLPFVVPQHQLAQFVPECISQVKFQKSCAFCGMTTAFYAISRGDFLEAYRLNSLSLFVYSLFLLNTFCTVLTLKHTIRFVKNLGATLRSHNVSS